MCFFICFYQQIPRFVMQHLSHLDAILPFLRTGLDWVMFTRRSPFTRQSGSVFDVVAAGEAWSEMIAQCEADKLVFPDESGVNTDLGRRYGRAIGGEQSVDKTPLNTPANTAVLSSVRRNGETVCTVCSGGTTRENFWTISGTRSFPHCTKGILLSWIICAPIMSRGPDAFTGSRHEITVPAGIQP